MSKVGFTANNGNRLELEGYSIKNVTFIPEQEMSSIESTRTIISPDDGVTVIGIEKNIVNTVTIKLIPNIKQKVSDNNAHEKQSTESVSVGEQSQSGKRVREQNTKGQKTS